MEEAAPQEKEQTDKVDDATRKEIEFKIGKKEGLLNEWISLQKEAEAKLMAEVGPIELSLEDKAEVSLCLNKIVQSQALEPVEIKYIVKALGQLIDGNKLSFSVLAEKIGKRLQEAGVLIQEDTHNMKILDFLAQKEELFRKCPLGSKVSACSVFELRELDMFKTDEELGGLYDQQSVRRKSVVVLDKLGEYISALESARVDQRSLGVIDACERKYTAAKTKLTQETVSRSFLLGIANKNKMMANPAPQKEPKVAPNNQASKEGARKTIVPDAAQGAKAGTMDEPPTQRSAIQPEAAPTMQANNSFITNFFSIKKQDAVVIPRESIPVGIFRIRLGRTKEVAEWSSARKREFEKVFDKNTKRTRGSDPSKNKTKSKTIADFRAELKERMVAAKKHLAPQVQAEGQPRVVYLKEEDYQLCCYGFRGKFSKQSALITGRRPLHRDEATIDYDLDSDEELEDLNGESIHSDDKDDEEEDEELDPEDGFVVADGYFSDEEINGSFDEEERSNPGL